MAIDLADEIEPVLQEAERAFGDALVPDGQTPPAPDVAAGLLPAVQRAEDAFDDTAKMLLPSATGHFPMDEEARFLRLAVVQVVNELKRLQHHLNQYLLLFQLSCSVREC